MPEDPNILKQKIEFANSAHVAIVIQILKECSRQEKLVGDTEYATIVNAVTMDAQGEMIIKFINSLDAIKKQNFTPQ